MSIFDLFNRKKENEFLANILNAPDCPCCHSHNTMKRTMVLIVKKDENIKRTRESRQSYFCNSCWAYFVESLEKDETIFDGSRTFENSWWRYVEKPK